jgi:hypothetical protein
LENIENIRIQCEHEKCPNIIINKLNRNFSPRNQAKLSSSTICNSVSYVSFFRVCAVLLVQAKAREREETKRKKII